MNDPSARSNPESIATSVEATPTSIGPTLDRRRFLGIAGFTILGGVAASVVSAFGLTGTTAPATTRPNATGSGGLPGSGPEATAGTGALVGTLPIPPVLTPEFQGGLKVFRLAMQQGTSQFLPGRSTPTFGFNGPYLGPTLRASAGDHLQIQVTNQLGEETTVHWHGMHLPAASDGGPHQTIADGATWSPEFTIMQPAATLWYHPHLLGQTLRQVGMGLVGLFILDDPAADPGGLPSTYGVDDLPLILQSQSFTADGQLRLAGNGGRGGGGAVTLVNGAISPSVSTDARRLRLRLLNASSQDFLNLGFADGAGFQEIASDGGLLTGPVQLTRLQLAPGERAEIVVDLTPGRSMVLQGFGGNGGGRGGNGGGNAGGTLLTINPTGSASNPGSLPAQLAVIDRLSAGSAVQTRDFILGGNDQNPTINGMAMTSMADMMDMSNTFEVALDTTEIWNVVNRSGDTHAFHVHDVQYQILDRDGGAPAATEAGLKDTVVVRPRETVRLIMRFTDYADPMTPYMYHCHLLNHEDNGMMGQFVVV